MTRFDLSKAAIFVRAPEPAEPDQAREPVGPDAPQTGSAEAPPSEDSAYARDVRRLRETLKHAFEEDPLERREDKPAKKPTEIGSEPASAARARPPSRAWTGKLLKVGIGLALVVVFGWMPLQTLLVASSVEAVVNSRIVTVRSPIDGVVAAAPHDSSAWSGAKGAPVLRIVDDKADRRRLDELRSQLGNLEDERPSLVARLDLTQASLDDLNKQTQQFADGRIRQLNARIAALNHDFAAASARPEEADAALIRAGALIKSGSVTLAESGRLQRDKTVAAENEAAARQRIEEASIELAAANQGLFLGDSYNDRPDSAQRAQEKQMRAGDLRGELRTRDAQIARLRADIADEATRYMTRSDVEVALPVSGRVWEVLTAPGEHVSRGQDLLRLLDCASAVVTANVSESIYNRLQVGSPVTFRPSAGGDGYAGTIVNLTGAAGAPANFAILPSTLAKEAYHVTVAVPQIAESAECGVGRTGRVIFEKGAAESSATSAEANALGLRP
jgi:multidrug resistance efflux pump